MSSAITSRVAKILAERALDDIKVNKININSKNPYEEEYTVVDKRGRQRVKKRARGIPRNISQHDGEVLRKVRRRAHFLDMSLFRCCGIRFGWSSVVALIPVIGDFIDVFLALTVIHKCEEIEGGLPKRIRAQMLFNIIIDFGIGLVPILGDIADAMFRANTRNAWVLEMYLTKKAEAERAGAVTDPDSGKTLPTHPEPARVQEARGGLLGFGSRRSPDEEMAMENAGNNRESPPRPQRSQ